MNPAIPNVNSPLVDPTRHITPPWYQYLASLMAGGGGGLAGVVDVNDFLETTDTNYDGAFQRAFMSGAVVYAPAFPRLGTPTYEVTDEILLDNGKGIIGDGRSLTVITQMTTNKPVIKLGTEIYYFLLRGLTVTHDGVAVAGGDGIAQGQTVLDWVNGGLMEDVAATLNYHGFNLGKAFYCDVSRCTANLNVARGWNFVTTGNSTVPSGAAGGPMQWYLHQCAAGQNGDAGYHWSTTGAGFGGAPASCGTMMSCTSYANGSYGVAAVGQGLQGIEAFRVVGGFFGEDGDHEIYLDCYGAHHIVKPDMLELAGAFGGSATACGVYVTANSNQVQIAVPQINGCKGDGIYIAGANCQVNGGLITNNGIGATAGRQNGIIFIGVVGMVTGVIAKDTGGTTQQYGVAGDTDGLLITGCDLDGNVAAAVNIPVPVPMLSQLTGNFPVLINEIFADQAHFYGATAFVGGSTGLTATTGMNVTGGGLTFTLVGGNGLVATDIQARSLGVGTGPTGTAGDIDITGGISVNAPTGGNLGAGTINVKASVNLNNVAYVNP